MPVWCSEPRRPCARWPSRPRDPHHERRRMAKKRRPLPGASGPDQEQTEAKKQRRMLAQEQRTRALRRRARTRTLRRVGGMAAGIAVAVALLFTVVRTSSGGVAFAGDIRTGGTLKSLKVPALQGGGTI